MRRVVCLLFWETVLLLLIFCSSAQAIRCAYADLNGTCCGDVCMAVVANRNNDEVLAKQVCLRGPAMVALAGKCVGAPPVETCFCNNTDMCNNNMEIKKPASDSFKEITCGNTIVSEEDGAPIIEDAQCLGCEAVRIGNDTRYFCSDEPIFDDFSGFLNNACVSVTSYASTGAVITCKCNSGDHCSRMIDEQTLKSDLLTCYTDQDGEDTCTGDLCFIQRNKFSQLRGCVTFNKTQQNAASVAIGYFTTLTQEVYVCNTDRCNLDWYTVEMSLSPEHREQRSTNCGALESPGPMTVFEEDKKSGLNRISDPFADVFGNMTDENSTESSFLWNSTMDGSSIYDMNITTTVTDEGSFAEQNWKWSFLFAIPIALIILAFAIHQCRKRCRGGKGDQKRTGTPRETNHTSL